MRRMRIAPLATVFALTACFTDENPCPANQGRGERCVPTDSEASSIEGGACYLDRDHDGSGAGRPVPCEGPDGGEVDGGSELALARVGGDCDDSDPDRAPDLEEDCDGLDNDCNGEVDDGVTNLCGGECLRPLDNLPGVACTNGLLGACLREGTYACRGDSAVVCTAPTVNASEELCDDNIDNDCDGLTDEADAVNAPFWYQDCDEDGFAASTTGAQRSCTKPPNAAACSWTTVIPQPDTKTNWDCNDALTEYAPNLTAYRLPPVGSTSWDFNCDGQTTSSPAPSKDEVEACSADVIDRLNSGDKNCVSFQLALDPDQDGRVDCTVWKSSSGKYTASPSSKCPDTGAYRVTGQYVIANGSSSCTVVPTSPVWPCR